MNPTQLVITAMSVIIVGVSCHVSLTFPPARKYALDFLDNLRTNKPCGMDKNGSSVRTSLPNDGEVEITWNMGNVYKGGFKLQLLDRRESFLKDLTPQSLYDQQQQQLLQRFTVKLTDVVCQDCTIRLEQRAQELGANYQFQSCADVDIVTRQDFQNDCSGRGSFKGAACQCQRTFYGDRCQYKDDCDDNQDCSSNGQCLDIPGGTNQNPRKQCFCQLGFFGANCERISAVVNGRKDFFSPGLYEKAPTGTAVEFYWRILPGNQMEGVIVGRNTESYVAIGFRPKSLSHTCLGFPRDAASPRSRDFHSMDCTDMIIGSVREGTFSRVEDYYTRDRSTPRPDAFYGGSSSLTGAMGWEADGRTIVMFRRPIRGDQSGSDHDFDGELHLIWAHGANVEEGPFFARDELKYHGPKSRGSTTISVSSAPASINCEATTMLLLGATLFYMTG